MYAGGHISGILTLHMQEAEKLKEIEGSYRNPLRPKHPLRPNGGNEKNLPIMHVYKMLIIDCIILQVALTFSALLLLVFQVKTDGERSFWRICLSAVTVS